MHPWRSAFAVSQAVQRINRVSLRKLTKVQLAGLRCGLDRWTKIRESGELEALISPEHVDAIREGLTDEVHRQRAMRWVLRGLEVRRAIRKVQVDAEIAAIRRTNHGVDDEEPDDE